jgi:DeoR/GlpR family transcriptional regulator of sugar metabolism
LVVEGELPSRVLAGVVDLGRPRGSGRRAQEVLGHVHKQPGITIAELAERMKIKAKYLYRVLPQLEKDGKLRERDKGCHPPEG